MAQTENNGGIAGVFVDFLPTTFALLLQSFEGCPNATEELEDNRGRDVRHDSQAEDRGLVKLTGAEDGDLLHELSDALAGLFAEEGGHFALVDDRQRDLPADSR